MVSYGTETQQKTVSSSLTIHPSWCVLMGAAVHCHHFNIKINSFFSLIDQCFFFFFLAKFGHFSTRNWGNFCFSSVITLTNFAI
jgi:hypothetical protein